MTTAEKARMVSGNAPPWRSTKALDGDGDIGDDQPAKV
jgi:hypothetical protein